MSQSTKSLRAMGKRLTLPLSVFALMLFAMVFIFQHNPVKAAPSAAGAPMDDASVSALTSLDQAVEAVAARVTPAVVNVAVTSRNHDQMAGQQVPPELFKYFGHDFGRQFGQEGPSQPRLERGIGSGVIVSPDGYIVTNNHVIDGAVEMKVTLNDRRVLPAKLIGTDKLTDLAVIKVNATNLPSIPWGDSTKLHPGQTVLAFGSPFGYFQFSVTRGIISALNRPNPFRDDPRKPGGFIQTDAAINPGNSGGALVDSHGEVIGINTFIISDSGSFAGAGFSIPSQIARPTVESLIKNGTVHHGYLGLGITDVTPDNAKFFNAEEASGALVNQVTPDSPAGKAGLRSGDVITKVNGERIVTGSDLQLAASTHAPGTTLALTVLRDGKSQNYDVKLGEYHADKEVAEASTSEHGHGRLGVAVADLTPDMRQQLQLPDRVKGVAVEQVNPGSPAEDAGIAQGDVILEVNRHEVASSDQLKSELQKSGKDQDVLLLVWSNGNATFRVVHPSQDENGM